MRISNDCVAIVKQFEQLRLTTYHCPAGVPTIGYGHTGPDVQPGQRITQPVAEQLLYGDLQTAAAGVAAALDKHKITVTQDQADALVSFAFNVGTGGFAKSSVLRRLATGDIPGAGEALLAWNKARVNFVLTPLAGLTRRREAERALFLGDVPRAFAIAGIAESSAMPQAIEPPQKEKRLDTSPTMAGGITSIAGGLATAATAAAQMSDSAREALATAPIPAHWFLLLIGLAVLVAGAVVVVRRYGYWASADKIETEIVSFAKSAFVRISEEAPHVPDIISAAQSAAAAARSFGAAAAPVVRGVAAGATSFSELVARSIAARRAGVVNADGVELHKGP